jgi:hypothetical protein
MKQLDQVQVGVATLHGQRRSMRPPNAGTRSASQSSHGRTRRVPVLPSWCTSRCQARAMALRGGAQMARCPCPTLAHSRCGIAEADGWQAAEWGADYPETQGSELVHLLVQSTNPSQPPANCAHGQIRTLRCRFGIWVPIGVMGCGTRDDGTGAFYKCAAARAEGRSGAGAAAGRRYTLRGAGDVPATANLARIQHWILSAPVSLSCRARSSATAAR